MGDVSYSIGVAKVTLDGSNLGSLTDAGISIDAVLVPRHEDKVGEAMLIGSRHVATSISGSLSLTCDELHNLESYFAGARSILNGIPTAPVPFECVMAGSPATVSGLVLPVPQFTVVTSQNSWTACTIRCDLCGPPTFFGASVEHDGAIARLVDFGSMTRDCRNLGLHDVTVSGVNGRVVESSLEVSCQVRPILRGRPRWAVAFVVDSVDVKFSGGIENFSGLAYRHDPSSPVTVTYSFLDGTSMLFNLGDKCNVTCGSIPRTGFSQWNYWQIKVTGNGF